MGIVVHGISDSFPEHLDSIRSEHKIKNFRAFILPVFSILRDQQKTPPDFKISAQCVLIIFRGLSIIHCPIPTVERNDNGVILT